MKTTILKSVCLLIALAAFSSSGQIFDDACKRAPAEYWLFDGVHPCYAGHQLMADEWVRTVKEAWPD